MSLPDQILALQDQIKLGGNHVYRVLDGEKWTVYSGTTTAIEKHMPKDWMGGWFAKEMYLESERELKALWASGEAQYKEYQWNFPGSEFSWMPDLGEILGIIKRAKGAARRKSTTAKDTGTSLHTLAEGFIVDPTSRPTIDAPELQVAWSALSPWLATVKPLLTEFRLFSRAYRVAGTGDLLAEDLSGVFVGDYKTWNYESQPEPYLKVEHVLQNHGYRGMLREMTGELVGGRVVVLPKDKDRPAVTFDVPWDESCWEAFLSLLKLNRWHKGWMKANPEPESDKFKTGEVSA